MQRVYSLPSFDPCRNLAVEEYLLRHGSGDFLLFWRNHNTIVVGRNQNTLEEIHEPHVRAHGVQVVRRMSGGGAVYHDLNNLNYSFITARRGGPDLASFLRPMVEALRAMGIAAEVSGRNDLVVHGRKVSGNAQALAGNRVLHHGTLLFDANLDALAACLRARPEKFVSKAAKSVRSRVGNLKDYWIAGAGIEDFQRELLQRLRPDGQCDTLSLTGAGEAAVNALAVGKYASWDWTYGRAPRFSLSHGARYAGGFLEVRLEVKGGVIVACALQGDFMARRGVEPVASALCGARHGPEDVARVLSAFPLDEYFGSLSLEQIVDCVLGAEA